jgi:hypothetical protein
VLREPSFLAMPRLLARGAKFDLVFVDGWHTFDFTLLDMFYAEVRRSSHVRSQSRLK